jgi:Tfp pilus assembly protein PilX
MKHLQKTEKRHSQNGMALLAVMIVLMFVLAISLIGVAGRSAGLGSTTRQALQSSKVRVETAEAWSLAESGVQATLQWLQDQAAPPQNANAFAPSDFFGGTADGGYTTVSMNLGGNATGTFSVRLYPLSDNDVREQKEFVIESIGRYQGKEQILRVSAAQDTFAKFAYFTHYAPADNSWWVSGSTKFRGPVHVNAAIDETGVPRTANVLWKNSGGATNNQIFLHNGADAFTTSADRINFSLNSTGNTTEPATTTDWSNVAIAGEGSVRTSVSQIPLPEASTRQKNAALGDWDSSAMSALPNGVYLPPNGGIYIKGDVSNLDFQGYGRLHGEDLLHYGGTGHYKQRITVYQTDTAANQEVRFVIEVDPATNQTTVRRRTAPLNSTSFSNETVQTYAGTTNKVLFTEGHIGRQGDPKGGGISGDIANNLKTNGEITHYNSWTVATPEDKDINLDNNILYQQDSFVGNTYTPNSSGAGNPTRMSGTLGIVSRKVRVNKFRGDVIGRPNLGQEITGISVHATVVAFDTFEVEDFINRGYTGSTINRTATILGGYICKKNGQFGTIFQNGSLRSGFHRDLRYDQRVAFTPPPHFPTTANRYILTSIQRVVETLE